VFTPLQVDLLGMKLAVWQDSKGQWQCFQDLCPHRYVCNAQSLDWLERVE
jgi:phenylpropionate dioxygenase-like ring-hydroxylating dioxygenase large terminal subunit